LTFPIPPISSIGTAHPYAIPSRCNRLCVSGKPGVEVGLSFSAPKLF
jgi:hypothetical protein